MKKVKVTIPVVVEVESNSDKLSKDDLKNLAHSIVDISMAWAENTDDDLIENVLGEDYDVGDSIFNEISYKWSIKEKK